MSDSYIEPEWDVQTLDGTPTDYFTGQSKIYALIESTLMRDWQQTLYQHINKFELDTPYSERLFAGTAYQSLQHGPVLVDITDYPQLQMLWLARFEELPAGCILLTHDGEQPSKLVSGLRDRLTVLKNNTPTFLRYYEPRMLLPFIGALSMEERQLFLPGVHAIYWYHHQWLNAHWPVKEARSSQLFPWNMTSSHRQKMTTIMTVLQSHEVQA